MDVRQAASAKPDIALIAGAKMKRTRTGPQGLKSEGKNESHLLMFNKFNKLESMTSFHLS